MKRLVCFGDSITARETFDNGSERLTPRLRRALTGWQVINAGISGNNTRDALMRLDNDVLSHHPDVVTIFFGANDAASHKQVGLAEYESNLHAIVQRIGVQRALLITPSPVDENRPRNRTNEIMRQYSLAAQRVAEAKQCQVIDLFSRMIQLPHYTCMLSDGLHFEETAYQLLSELILDKLEVRIEQNPKIQE